MNQYVQVDFNSIESIDGFSFITGSQNRLPLQWLAQGSINGTDWVTLHRQTTNLVYRPPISGILAFYNPGIFQFTATAGSAGSAGSSSATAISTNQSGAYSNNIVTEGFVAKVAKAVKPSNPVIYKEPVANPLSSLYTAPLEAAPIKAPMFQELETNKRIKAIRFKILETQNPDSPFVHMSMLRFHTKSGTIPPECIQISNPQGSRRSAKDRPDSLLGASAQERWVDYNKSELLIQFKTEIMPADPINGIQFHVPQGFQKTLDACPAKWKIEGSYDRRNWFPLHEKLETARIIGASSPVYRFEM